MRKHSLEDYARVRADSLSDFDRANQYNSPVETMKRLKQAGLNPHLVYGNGAVTTAAPIKSSDIRAAEMRSWNPAVPKIENTPGNLVSGFLDTEIKEAQLDLIRKNTEVAGMEALLKAANIDLKHFDFEFKKEFRGDLAQKLIDQTRNLFLTGEGLRADAQVKQQTIDSRIQYSRESARIKEIERGLMEMGLSFRDPLFERLLAQALNNPDLTWKDILRMISMGGGKGKGLPKIPQGKKPGGQFKYWDPKHIK